jgi:hypothetical protein
MDVLMKKTGGRKSRGTVPLNLSNTSVSNIHVKFDLEKND